MPSVNLSEIREQVTEAFEGADYPVTSPMDLLPALPNGPATTFESGDFSMSVMEMQNMEVEDIDTDPDFPYESLEEIVDDTMEGFEAFFEQEGYDIER